jgi:2'-5' RNA ligase
MPIFRRSVLLFPGFPDEADIEHVRRLFDPAYTKIKPHITLVFPFFSEYTAEEIQTAVASCVTAVHPFILTMHEIRVKDTFIFMLPSEGGVSIAELFRALHSGLFGPYLPPILQHEEFIPHMTIGTCSPETSKQRLEQVRSLLGEYTTRIHTISVEVIGSNGEAVIESEIPLK